jgi:hypothetical protein
LTDLLTARAELLLRETENNASGRSGRLADVARVVRKLRGQRKLHAEAVSASLRIEGDLLWLRGRETEARAAWQASLVAAAKIGSLTEEMETHGAIARYAASSDRDAAGRIAARLRNAAMTGASA